MGRAEKIEQNSRVRKNHTAVFYSLDETKNIVYYLTISTDTRGGRRRKINYNAERCRSLPGHS